MAKNVPIKNAKQAARLRQAARVEAFYQVAYETLRAVVDFKGYASFKVLPRHGKVIVSVVNEGTQRKPSYKPVKESGYHFTPAQKALLSKLATYKPTPEQLIEHPELKRVNRRIRSGLFNSADGVKNKAFTLVKLNKKQQKFFKKNQANTVTNKGLILKSEALEPKIKKLGDGYAITFSPPKKDGTKGQRKEVYVPIPNELYGHFSAIQAFMARVNEISRASNFTLAIRTYHGKTTIHPKLFLRYTQELNETSPEAFSDDNPFISGFYIITFKNVSPEKLVEQINADDEIKNIIENPESYDEDDF